ncbi:MAG: hypothetical protein AAGJ35_00070 [Myxococcota bacterium]
MQTIPAFYEQARLIPIQDLAHALGLKLSAKKNAATPCPSCNAKVRSVKNKDKRPPLGFRPDRRGFACHHCQIKGDGLDLVALCLASDHYRKLSPDQQQKVHTWYIEQGFIHPPTSTQAHRTPQTTALKRHLSQSDLCPNPSTPNYPPQQQVQAVWEQSISVTQDPQVRKKLRQWSISPETLEHLDLARVLPRNYPIPPWMSARGRSWLEGWRLLIPARDPQGNIRSFKARWIHEPPPPAGLKSTSPKGFQIKGLLATNHHATLLLQQQHPIQEPLHIWFLEGEKDLLCHCSQQFNTQKQAAFAIWAGSWNTDFAQAITKNPQHNLLFALDHDNTGQRYRKHILRTLLLQGFSITQCRNWKHEQDQ